MIVYDQNNVQLEYQPEISTLAVRWVGMLEAETVNQMIHQIVAVVQLYAIKNILLDATQVDTLSKTPTFEAQVRPHFQQPLAIPTVKKIARVSSGNNSYDEAFSQLYVTLVQENRASFAFKTFNHHYEAFYWLTEK